MNKIIVTHTTAIKYWRRNTLDETVFSRMGAPPTLSTQQYAVDEVLLHALGFDTAEVHLLVDASSPRRNQQGLRLHHWKGRLPRGSVRKVRDDVFVASPEMCFLFAAREMNLYSLIMYGAELCGTYANDDSLPFDERYGRTPLTTKTKLSAFLERCKSHDGIQLARQALRFVIDGSASAMETALTMLLCMPPRHGGYGIPFPKLNEKVSYNNKTKRYAGVDHNKCDLCWLDDDLVVEYDSTESHYGELMRTKDVKRANVIEHAGKRVITVTWQMVNNPEELETVAEMVAKQLNHRLDKRMERRRFVYARNLLRKEVLPKLEDRWNGFG